MRQYGWSWGLCDHPVGIGGAAGRGLRRCYRDCGVSVGLAVWVDAACAAATGIVGCLSDWRCGWTRLAPLLQGLWGVCGIGGVGGRGLRRCYGNCGVSVGSAARPDATCAAATGFVGCLSDRRCGWTRLATLLRGLWAFGGLRWCNLGRGAEIFCSSGASRVGGAWGWPAASPYGFCGGLIAPEPADRAGRAIPAPG